jgi:two-component system, cell cycle response regulator DivK
MATVLVIEDNPQNLKLAHVVLHKAGHTVLTTDNAQAGLRLASEQHPDVILMDVQMPGMDGLTATQHLRGNPQTADIKIVALTALAMKGDAQRILAAGFDAYLAKPFRYQDLMDIVTRSLEG